MPASPPARRPKRPYEMRERARSVEATRERILDATRELIFQYSYDELTLQLVAEHAGTTFQTILRHFGSKDGLIAAVAQHGSPDEFAARVVTPGDVRGVARVLCGRYEETADATLQWEALEDRVDTIAAALADARAGHRRWLEEAFAPQLDGLTPAASRDAVTLLYAATDINTWRLWRRRLGLSATRTARAMEDLVNAVLQAL